MTSTRFALINLSVILLKTNHSKPWANSTSGNKPRQEARNKTKVDHSPTPRPWSSRRSTSQFLDLQLLLGQYQHQSIVKSVLTLMIRQKISLSKKCHPKVNVIIPVAVLILAWYNQMTDWCNHNNTMQLLTAMSEVPEPQPKPLTLS